MTIQAYNAFLMRESILHILQQEKHVSGQMLSQRLGISRTAVWKHINVLRRMGYEIRSSTHSGYSFISGPDLLTTDEISYGLNTSFMGRRILYSSEVISTQDIAEHAAKCGYEEGTIAIAEKQTGGRGRRRRQWVSPIHGGIYLSIILRPPLSPDRALQIPLIAGVAAIRAIREKTQAVPTLKWPNDIMLNGEKIGGILAEMSSDIDEVHHIILGIGLNVNIRKSRLPATLQKTAGSLIDICGQPISRVKLVQSFLSELEKIYEKFLANGFDPIRKEWLYFSSTIGSRVSAISRDNTIEGIAIDIDRDGFLIIEESQGHHTKIISGDVIHC